MSMRLHCLPMLVLSLSLVACGDPSPVVVDAWVLR